MSKYLHILAHGAVSVESHVAWLEITGAGRNGWVVGQSQRSFSIFLQTIGC